MRHLTFAVVVLSLSIGSVGCRKPAIAVPKDLSKIQVGWTMEQVKKELGEPDKVDVYRNQYDTTEYFGYGKGWVTLVDGKVSSINE